MSFALKKTIIATLRDVGVKSFDAAAVTALCDHVIDGGEESLKDIARVWKSGQMYPMQRSSCRSII